MLKLYANKRFFVKLKIYIKFLWENQRNNYHFLEFPKSYRPVKIEPQSYLQFQMVRLFWSPMKINIHLFINLLRNNITTNLTDFRDFENYHTIISLNKLFVVTENEIHIHIKMKMKSIKKRKYESFFKCKKSPSNLYREKKVAFLFLSFKN